MGQLANSVYIIPPVTDWDWSAGLQAAGVLTLSAAMAAILIAVERRRAKLNAR